MELTNNEQTFKNPLLCCIQQWRCRNKLRQVFFKTATNFYTTSFTEIYGMKPRFETIGEKKLMGKRLTMSLTANRTAELWSSFMPRRKEIQNSISSDLYSMQVYAPFYFEDFDPGKAFEKWAAVEVSDFETVPDGMETYFLPKGLYAVFDYKGSSTDTTIFQYIFTSWLPNSNYLLDSRPHFEILNENYKNESSDSQEEIWIPVKPKGY